MNTKNKTKNEAKNEGSLPMIFLVVFAFEFVMFMLIAPSAISITVSEAWLPAAFGGFLWATVWTAGTAVSRLYKHMTKPQSA